MAKPPHDAAPHPGTGLATAGLAVAHADGRVLVRSEDVFASGRVTAVLGPNGAGKSTLLRAVLGLAPPGFTLRGAVSLGGADLHTQPPAVRARRIAYCPQGGTPGLGLSVGEVLRLAGLAADPVTEARVDAALDAADLPADRWRDRAFASLSGGERQRVRLARTRLQAEAFARPGAVLADEPLTALDPRHRLAALHLFRALADAGHAVVVVLHDLRAALRHADDALLFDRGQRQAAGPVGDVLSDANLRAIYGLDRDAALA